MATSNGAAREARRRKIMERGSDRLALITGRIENLPSDSTSHHISSAPSDELGSMPTNDVDSGHLTSPEASVQNDSTRAEDAASDVVGTSTSPILSDHQSLGSQTQTSRFFTPTQISSAIAASKRSRLFASVLIAILVVLSHLGHPLIGGSILKSITGFRPLYLVLVTHITLVLARLFFNNQRVSGRPLSVPSSGGNDWTEQAGKVLETGLALQKAIDALVMDFSIYTIITVCGISLVSRSGA